MRNEGERIAILTAYDYSTATLLDMAKIDVILVGDSAANVMAGFKTTLPITLDEMIYHASSVVRAVKHALVVVDMPFGTYQGNSKEALNSAIRIMKESGADAIKLEGSAKAEANEKIAKSMTPELIAHEQIEKWSGNYPAVMMGEGATPIINLPEEALDTAPSIVE